jgi:hypothetical protein
LYTYLIDYVIAPLVFIILVRSLLIIRIRNQSTNLNQNVDFVERRRARNKTLMIKFFITSTMMAVGRLLPVLSFFARSSNDQLLNDEIFFSSTLLAFVLFNNCRPFMAIMNNIVFRKRMLAFYRITKTDDNRVGIVESVVTVNRRRTNIGKNIAN